MNCKCKKPATVVVNYTGGRSRLHCDECYRMTVRPALVHLPSDTYTVRFLEGSTMWGERLHV